jgi:putative flippase GtrA
MGGGHEPIPDYPALTVDSSHAEIAGTLSRARVGAALRRRKNWEQLVRFCIVGASGYAVNLWVFSTLVLGEVVVGPFSVASLGFETHYIPAAVCSFLVAVTNNYVWNRVWTFRAQRGHVAYQGLRFLVISTLALAANLVVLHALVTFGLSEVVAQAIAIVLVTPVNFVGNKLWSFAPRP